MLMADNLIEAWMLLAENPSDEYVDQVIGIMKYIRGALPAVPKFIIDDVVPYVKAMAGENHRIAFSEFEYCRLPYPLMWMEGENFGMFCIDGIIEKGEYVKGDRTTVICLISVEPTEDAKNEFREEHPDLAVPSRINYFAGIASFQVNEDNFFIPYNFNVIYSADLNAYATNNWQLSGDQSPADLIDRMMNLLTAYTVGAFTFLNCVNIVPKKVSISRKLQKSRIKKNKKPFYDYKILTIPGIRGLGISTGKGIKKRMHIRRGNFHRCKTGIYWWSPALIGRIKEGFADKDYAIKMPRN